jgi:hypothetical protein
MGVDPGLKGGIAFYFPSHPNRVSAEDMPTVNQQIDAHTLGRRIEQLRPDVAIIELVGARPGQGVSSMFNFGEGCGAIRGVLVALNVPITFVPPSTWKKHFRLSKDKDESRQRALELFPVSRDLFTLKKHEGRAEAALIARFYAEIRMKVAA